MTTKRFDLYVPMSDDGLTEFAAIGDILDHLATLWAWHPDVHAFLITRAEQARAIDRVYSESDDMKALTLKEVEEHRRANPLGCGVSNCDVCRSTLAGKKF
jgi:hypothetical protein